MKNSRKQKTKESISTLKKGGSKKAFSNNRFSRVDRLADVRQPHKKHIRRTGR